MTNNTYINIKYYWFLIFICLFFPGMISTFGLLLEQLLTITLFGLSCFLVFYTKTKVSKRIFYTTLFYYFTFSFLVLISLFRSTNIIITNDLIEIVKPAYFTLFFLLPFCFNFSYANQVKTIKFIMACCLALVIFGLFEAWTDTGLKLSTLLYKENRSVLTNKAVASFIITYVFASFLILPFFYFFIKAIVHPRMFNKNYILSFLVLSCLISTQSKTVLISFMFTIIAFFILYLSYRFTPNKKRLRLLLILFVTLLLVGIGFLLTLFEDNLSYIYKGISIVLNAFIDGGIQKALYSTPSVSLRYEQFMFAFDAQNTIPVIGVAIGKGVLMPESLYAMYLYRYGILGGLLHFVLVYILFKYSYKNAKFFSDMKEGVLFPFFLALHFYALSLPLSYFSSAVNDQTRTGFMFYSLLALTLIVNEKKQKLLFKAKNNF